MTIVTDEFQSSVQTTYLAMLRILPRCNSQNEILAVLWHLSLNQVLQVKIKSVVPKFRSVTS